MKNLLYLFLIGVLFSCGGSGEDELNPEEPDVNGEPKEYIVSLGMTGEIEVSESPLLGRASSDDLYGIQVNSKTWTSISYSSYAWGIFDDKSKMKIRLLSGYQYNFQATVIKNGKKLIYSNDGLYSAPFYNLFTNEFSYEGAMSGVQNGMVSLEPQGLQYHHPNIDRYYGEVEDYTPTENGSILIDMKRVVYGLKFVADGLTEGKLKISVVGSPDQYITHGENNEVESIFSLYGGGNKWIADDYSEIIEVSVIWEKADGASVQIIKSNNITVKRKHMTTVTIKVKDSSVNNGVEINQEPGNLIDGDNITLESGTGVDSPVEPNV